MNLSLEGKVALITGATRGIGAAILTEIGKMGAIVIGTATSEAGANQISGALEANGLKGMGVVLNVTAPDAIDRVVKDIETRFGPIQILVNNAGITRDNLMLRMKDEEWDAIMQTNLTSVFRLSRVCLKGMMKARWGRIISIGSVVGSMGNPGQANYCAAKAGVIGFSKSLAREIGSRGITVNVVAPGFIDTDMTRSLDESQKTALLATLPLGFLGEPKDIAAGVAFLASDAARYITGTTLHINGGMYMD